MERGRTIAGRAKRESDLYRYVQGKKVKIMVALPGHPFYEPTGRVNLFYVDDVMIGHEQVAGDEYPSEGLMAVIAMAVGATVGFDGIPHAETIDPAVRAQRNVYRDQMAQNLRILEPGQH